MGSFDQMDRYRALQADLVGAALLADQQGRAGSSGGAAERDAGICAQGARSAPRSCSASASRQPPRNGLGRRLRPPPPRVAPRRHAVWCRRSWAARGCVPSRPARTRSATTTATRASRRAPPRGQRHPRRTRGAPIVAPVAGTVSFRSVSLGGRSFFLEGVDGNEYFGTHLSGYAGGARSVSAGEVIGDVGDDGNARGTPHLHFEIHPGHHGTINPYPTLSAHC